MTGSAELHILSVVQIEFSINRARNLVLKTSRIIWETRTIRHIILVLYHHTGELFSVASLTDF
jgi:hypothetical protein